MGFYSFYRIFKDIIKTLFGNKAFKYFLIFAIICIVVLFANKSFASDLRPWNVYTNTTEFNWSSLTNFNYVVNNIDYNYYKVSANEIYYLYNPNSNTGTLHLYTYLSTDGSKIMAFYDMREYQSFTVNEAEYYFSEGYIDVPYNKPFTPMADFYIAFAPSTGYELYLFDDKYSNIEAYNELSAISSYLYGSSTDISAEFSVVNNLTIGDPTSNGSFSSTSSASQVYYMSLEEGRITNLDFTVTLNPTYSYVVVGYCDAIPSNGVPYIHYSHYTGSGSFNVTGSFSSHKYLFVRTIGGSITLNSSTVSNVGLEGMNNNATYQAEATRETITDSSISQDTADYSLPTDSTNDITQDGFNTIFERIRSTFTSGSGTPLVVTIPFTNKSFTISYDTVYGSANLGLVRSIIESFWWFIISLFITKDIFKKIEKIKTGNIEFTETTNIKEDIL